jgi:hypothetical protein
MPTRLRPCLDGPFWLLGPNPPLPAALTRASAEAGAPHPTAHECVDHHAFQSADGRWHLWGCVRRTAVGRVLYHWEGADLEAAPWTPTGEIVRADAAAGESLEDWFDEEWIQSPYVVRHAGQYYFFYGGHGTGRDADGQPVPPGDPRMACQLCLMTSSDGRHWQRYRSDLGQSRLFTGPGEARDPFVARFDGQWHLYYAGYHNGDPAQAGIYLRTSDDLLHWSDWRLVLYDHATATGRWSHECPQVAYRAGYYYLFRTEDYASARTHVYRSEDPADFGIGTSEKYIGPLAVAAPEIITAAGREYITSNHDLFAGTQICRLAWQPD